PARPSRRARGIPARTPRGRALRVRSRIRALRFVARFGWPENLAVLRIALSLAVLTAPDLWDAPRWAVLPAALGRQRGVVADALFRIPVSSGAANVALVAAVAGTGLGLIGVATRLSLGAAALASL